MIEAFGFLQSQIPVVCLTSFIAAALAALCLSVIGSISTVGHDLHSGVQKFHSRPTSRLGSLAIVIGLGVAYLNARQIDVGLGLAAGGLLLASVPAFVGGIVEDLTHKVGTNARLLLTLVSASVCYFFMDIAVLRTDVPPVDWLLSLPAAEFLVTLLVVGGFTHSVNIIDGFHGLASGLVMVTLSALLAMAWVVNDGLIVKLCSLTLAATLGFFLANWPWGKIFLGDAGAYLLGFWTVELGLLLTSRHSDLSPMAPVVAGIMPLTETLFSMYRRKFVRHHPVNRPDRMHLHSLIYQRLLLNPRLDRTSQQVNAANCRVALYLWPPALVFAILSCLFIYDTRMQLILMVGFFVMYHWLYRRLVKFKSPGWLIWRSRSSGR